MSSPTPTATLPRMFSSPTPCYEVFISNPPYSERVHLQPLPPQNVFMFNLAVSNLILSVLGTFRGLGIISPIFVRNGDNSDPNALCGAYAIALNTLG